MDKLTNQKQFAKTVTAYVQNALPTELSEAVVRVERLNLWADGARMVLLIIRPWNGITTGVCLDTWYQKYANGNAAPHDAAAAIINDRRLYVMPYADSSMGTFLLEGGAAIYIYA